MDLRICRQCQEPDGSRHILTSLDRRVPSSLNPQFFKSSQVLKSHGSQKLWLFVKKYVIGTKFNSTIEKPSAERYAVRRPPQPMRRAANSSNEYTAQQRSATKIFGSCNDIAYMRGSSAADGMARTSAVNTTPAIKPAVRKIHPITMACWFM